MFEGEFGKRLMQVPKDLDDLSRIIGIAVGESERAVLVAWEKARADIFTNASEPCEPPTRWRLPDERESLTHRFKIPGDPGLKGYLIMGLYPSGRLGELFLEISKEGSFVSGVLDGLMTTISIALQHGVPLKDFTAKFRGMNFEPAGMISIAPKGMSEGGLFVSSILDYIAKYLNFRFPEGVLQIETEGEINVRRQFQSGIDDGHDQSDL